MAEYNPISPPGSPPILTENALAVLQDRYLVKDETGKSIESPAELFSRVAKLIADTETRYGVNQLEVEKWHKRYYDLMASLKFLPNSPTLMNANRPLGMLSACFVLPIEDNVEAIFETIKLTALIQKAGGGTGFSFDKLRPTGDRVASSGGVTSGPMSFWRVFSEATNAIQQGAFRRGANMAMMGVEHPDIIKFLHAKQNLKAFTNFNISVKITDSWMEKLEHAPKSFHVVTNPRNSKRYLFDRKLDIAKYTINDLFEITGNSIPKRGNFYSVADIWGMLINCAHKTAEPGVAFIDRINLDNPTPSLGQIEATNPCGEQPLLPYEACTLGSINLARFIVGRDKNARMDWAGLAETITLAVRFLDNIIDACDYPASSIVQLSQANRKIGLGVMGFADCLFAQSIRYDSDEGIEFGDKLMKFINSNAQQASAELANIRGPFANWANSTWRTQKKIKVRNASITCVAPTGTISIISDCSCGIEPIYSLVFVRQILNGKKFLQTNPVFKAIAEEKGFYSKKLEKQIAKTGTIQQTSEIPPRIRKLFRCSSDIAPEWHIRMQAVFQKHCDAAISKTINFAENATVSDVERAYKLAYELGCKGVTIYRKGTRPIEPMSLY